MEKETRNRIQRATQAARQLIERDYSEQLEGTFDVLLDGTISADPGDHLSESQCIGRQKLIEAIAHKRSAGMKPRAAVEAYLREAAFTMLNRLVALKMLEARGIVQECISGVEESSGFKEFIALAPGFGALEDKGYRLYIESIFDEISREVGILFDRRDVASLLWPRRQALEGLLAILNDPELASVWEEDETIGWVYQYFNSEDERREMRAESAAPRNSRELAVRNQFFTPRYVVEFLTDNTLGRIWWQMTGGETELSKRCLYLVKQDEEQPPRPRKDPRDIKILDPACGSGHFLLYAFDLLHVIYGEAWDDASHQVPSKASGRSLRQDYPQPADLRRALPALILEYNLHGVDIDPRAAQIAALTLWLRAQRAFKENGVPAEVRAPVTKTNVVIAEAMPGDQEMVQTFARTIQPPLLGGLFEHMASGMDLAGELGTLLRIEEAIAAKLEQAREDFIEGQQSTGFLPGMEPALQQGELDFSGIDDTQFFHKAEDQIVEALRRFAEERTNGPNVRRRLFVGDAAQGIALIDLVRNRFDVVLMNPPFGACSLAGKKEFERSFPRTKNDLYAAFVERGVELLEPAGMLGAISSRTGFFLKSFQQWREEVLIREAPPVVFADLGYGVMDSAVVEAAAYCLQKGHDLEALTTTFLRIEDAENRGAALHRAIHRSGSVEAKRFEVALTSFSAVPGTPFCYWVSDKLRSLFSGSRLFESGQRTAKQGLASGDDGRFIRTWWEVEATEALPRGGWAPLVKGGSATTLFPEPMVVVNWFKDGRELKAFASAYRASRGWGDQWSAMINASEYYFRPGITWPLRAARFAPSVMPSGCAFSTRGCAAFAEEADLPWLLAIMKSQPFEALFRMTLSGARPEFTIGAIQKMPVPDPTSDQRDELTHLFVRDWSLRRRIGTSSETSRSFGLPSALFADGTTLSARSEDWGNLLSSARVSLAQIQAEIDHQCFRLYDIDGDDRLSVIKGFQAAAKETSNEGAATGSTGEDGHIDVDVAGFAAEMVSWAMGVALGRFDVRLAMGDVSHSDNNKPFDPLPACSPGMLTDNSGFLPTTPPDGYPLNLPNNGLLVDDPGHDQDITASMRRVFEKVFGDESDAFWNETSLLVGSRRADTREWLSRSCFDSHIKQYSVSRRKAPIYWQLATPSASYSVWLYYHCLTADTMFKVLNDYIGPKVQHEERRLASQIQDVGPSRSAGQRKEIADHESHVEELRLFRDEVTRVAPLWNPNLNDGVIINFAPLWRLVPQNKAWQKECKKVWDKLVKGDYDWAHLAMHLWPERVVPKCTKDRSLAIAHGLEDEFWFEDSDGKCHKREAHGSRVSTLVEKRTSPAVKAALEDLLSAPAPVSAKAKRGRKRSSKKTKD